MINFFQSDGITKKILLVYLLVYFLVNLFFLTDFPVMHSDESWLSGLSRQLAATGDFSATEPFFDLKPRTPHALRIIFHGIQTIFIKLFGYHLFGMRLLSLCFAIFGLYCFYFLSYRVFSNNMLALFATLGLSLDIQYIYSAHLARPEIVLLTSLIGVSYYFRQRRDDCAYRHDLLLAMITGLSIGIHPNGFLIALVVSLYYLFHIKMAKSITFRNFLCYAILVAIAVVILVAISIHFTPTFLTDYFAYGHAQFKVLNPVSAKCLAFYEFYRRIYWRDTGTYWLPDLKIQMIIFSVLLILTLIQFIMNATRRQRIILPLLAISGVNLGMLLIGRFNQTSIVFQTPFAYLLLADWLTALPAKMRRISVTFSLILLLVLAVKEIVPFWPANYETYLQKISEYIPNDQPVLASLNTEYYFDLGKLHDFRNLAYLRHHHMTFAGYIQSQGIRYIVYPDSIDWMHHRRPRWNQVYGDLSRYYRELRDFLREECVIVGEFSDRMFGVEIGGYLGKRDWRVTIYQVRNSPNVSNYKLTQ